MHSLVKIRVQSLIQLDKLPTRNGDGCQYQKCAEISESHDFALNTGVISLQLFGPVYAAHVSVILLAWFFLAWRKKTLLNIALCIVCSVNCSSQISRWIESCDALINSDCELRDSPNLGVSHYQFANVGEIEGEYARTIGVSYYIDQCVNSCHQNNHCHDIKEKQRQHTPTLLPDQKLHHVMHRQCKHHGKTETSKVSKTDNYDLIFLAFDRIQAW